MVIIIIIIIISAVYFVILMCSAVNRAYVCVDGFIGGCIANF
jgi:hypothetical protein